MISRAASIPFRRGILTSRTARSGAVSRASSTASTPSRACAQTVKPSRSREVKTLLLLLLIAVLAIAAFGVAFTIHWLFIIAVVLALVWLISFFAGTAGGRSRGAWW